MSLREVPYQIGRALRRYHFSLRLEWDDESSVWYLCDGSKRLFATDHEDGTPMRNIDGATDEILRIVHRMDMHKHYGDIRKRMRLTARRLRASRREATEGVLADASTMARDRARTMKKLGRSDIG